MIQNDKDFYNYLNDHEKEFLNIRLSGVGYDVATCMMRERYKEEIKSKEDK